MYIRKLGYGLIVVCLLQACRPSAKLSSASPDGHAATTAAIIADPANKKVLVTAHRGDWRNAPENSLPALKYAIEMGVDIVELDLKRTKDGQLVIMHDRVIDRTTSGKGAVADFTLNELRKYKLKNGLGRVTTNEIPTFAEYLDIAKGKILIDVDKGYEYYPEVIQLLREKSLIEHAIINIDDNSTLDQVEAKQGKVAEDIWLMPIVDYKDSAKARIMIDSYRRHKRTIFQPVWSDDKMIATADFQQLRKDGFGVWLNSLWPTLNGGHDDDGAVERNQPDATWGWLIGRGATIMQSDRPGPLLQYLLKRKLH